jgi:hypothetical protein
MSDPLAFQLSALAMLVSLLCWCSWQRNHESWRLHREDRKRERTFRKHWRPIAFDVSSISPQIQQLRQMHVEMSHHRSRHAGYRNELIAAFRAKILRQPYFRIPNCEVKGDSPGEHQLIATRPD